MHPVQLFGSSTKSLSAFISAQERINVFYEIVADSEKQQRIVMRDFPGDSTAFDLPYENFRGSTTIENLTYAVYDNSLLLLRPNGTYETLGEVGAGVTGKVSMANNGTQVLMAMGNQVFLYDTTTTLITIPPLFPLPCNSVIFSDGFFLANQTDTPNFYKSSLFDGSTWDPLDFDQMVTNPDSIMVLDALRGLVIGYGSQSIEFWQINPNLTPFPYGQLSGTTQNIGLAAPFSRAFTNNTIAFLGTNLAGQVQVFAFDGYTPTRISDSSIENLINSFATVADATALAFSKDGHALYVISFPSANRSFMFDFLTGGWSTVQTGVSEEARYFADGAFVMNNNVYLTTNTGGKIYKLEVGNYTHDGETMKRSFTSRHIEDDGNFFSIDELWLDMEIGTAPQAPAQGWDPKMIIECSKDNASTFPITRIVPMAKLGQYLAPRLITYRFGSARNFDFRFTITDPVPCNIIRGCIVTRKGEVT